MAWPRIKNSRSSAQPGTHPHDGVQAVVTPAPSAEPPPGTGQNTGVGGTRHAVANNPSPAASPGPDSPRTARRRPPIRYAHSKVDQSAAPADTAGELPDPGSPRDPQSAGTVLSGVVLPGRGPAAAEQRTGYRRRADEPAPPAASEPPVAQDEPPVPNEGLGIFGGVATTEASDDPPARQPGRAPRRPSPRRETAGGQSGPGPGTTAGPARNFPAAGPAAASGPAEERKPKSFALLREFLAASAADDGGSRTSLRDLPPDVQLNLWRIRLIIMLVVGGAFALLTRSWEIALTLAILAGIIDTVYRSRNAGNYRTEGPQPGARRRTSRQLARMRRQGYFSVEGRHIPGSPEIIDHLVIGPSGVYAIDSEKWDHRLPIRVLNGKRLYLGPDSQKDRLDHAAWEAAQASAVLSEALGSEIPVRAALAIFGPRVPWDIATIRNVDVFTGSALNKYLKRRGRRKDGVVRLTREQVRTIYDTASRLLPDVGAQSGSYTPVG